MSMLSASSRAALIESLMKNGVARPRATIAVDLAAHACDQANETFMRVLERAPDLSIGLSATQIATQVLSQQLAHAFETMHDLAKAAGAPSNSVVI